VNDALLPRWRRWWAGIRSGGVYGKAFARFYQGRYDDAAVLLERADALDADSERLYFSHSLRGRCYRALGRYKEALEYLSRAYEPYCRQRDALDSEFSKREFVEYLSAFSDVLLRTGHVDRADEVARLAIDQRTRWRIG